MSGTLSMMGQAGMIYCDHRTPYRLKVTGCERIASISRWDGDLVDQYKITAVATGWKGAHEVYTLHYLHHVDKDNVIFENVDYGLLPMEFHREINFMARIAIRGAPIFDKFVENDEAGA